MRYKGKPPEGSVAELVLFYRENSPEYARLGIRRRYAVDKVLGDLMAFNGRAQVSSLTMPKLVRMRDSLSKTPAKANNAMGVIRQVLDYGVTTGFIASSPWTKLKKLPPKAPGGFRSWREDEIDAYLAHWPAGSLQRLVMVLALCTGAAAVDLVKLGWGNVDADRIRYRRQKTEGGDDAPVVSIPILPELAEVLALVPRTHMTFLQTRDGFVRSHGGLGYQFREWVDAAGLGAPDKHGRRLTLHGLRKAVGRRLAERGASPHTIMAWLGHKNVASAETYTRAYNREMAADAGAELLGKPQATNVTRLKREPKP